MSDYTCDLNPALHNTENPHYYLAIDPGEKRTGWATFNETGNELTGNGIITGDLIAVGDWLFREFIPAPKKVICETYRIKDFQHKHHWEKIPTIRVIGLIEWFAYYVRAEFIEQESGAYKTGMMWGGVKVPKGHVKDNQSAFGHGVYYLQKIEKKWKIRGFDT